MQRPIPAGFIDTPPPNLEPAKLVNHVEEITIDRALDVVIAEGNWTSLKKTMHRMSSFPASQTHTCFAVFGPSPGARRVTCLTDGGTTEEQVIANVRSGNTLHFCYEFTHNEPSVSFTTIIRVGSGTPMARTGGPSMIDRFSAKF